MVIADDRIEPPATESLLARARGGDAQAFCALVEPHQTRLYRQAVALCRDEHAANDLVSETLVEAWKSLGRYRATCRLSTWLYAILLHRHQKAARRARSRPVVLAWLSIFESEQHAEQHVNLSAPGGSPADAASQGEAAAQLRRAIDALPEKHRAVIRLRFFEDASLADIAVVLDCSVGTVKSRLHHALEKLRQMNLSELRRDT